MTGADERARLRAALEAMPHVTVTPYTPPRAAEPLTAMYKLVGKLFAILTLRGEAYVIVKCDPYEVDLLLQSFAGARHRTHLDRRFWIALDLASDIPFGEIERLAEQSYERVRAGLTRKQQAALGA